jgi:hypothetical protein
MASDDVSEDAEGQLAATAEKRKLHTQDFKNEEVESSDNKGTRLQDHRCPFTKYKLQTLLMT